MSARVSLATLARTNSALFDVQQQISTGKAIQQTSDDIVKAATIGVLEDRLSRSSQITRNLQHADSALSESDSTLGEASTIALQAKSIASAQVATTTSSSERTAQVTVVDGLIQGLFNVGNRKSVAGYVLGADQSSVESPVQSFLGGYRYAPRGSGLVTDLGTAVSVPLTLGKENPIASVSSRVKGGGDYNPDLTADTRIADLAGARGLGVTLGTIEYSVDGSTPEKIDLAGCDTIDDVRRRLEQSLRTYETANATTVLGTSGVSLAGSSLRLDVVGTGNAPAIVFSDIGNGVTAADLGLTTSSAPQFDPGDPIGGDLNPRVTWRTPVDQMQGLSGSLGSIRISNAGHSAVVDLSHATTLQDVRNLIQGTNLGVRVEINESGTAIDVMNELATASSQSMSISEVAGDDTASRLGIRTLGLSTQISDFNFGDGVQIANGATDATTGLPDPAHNTDFDIVLGDANATHVTVDLRPQDMVNVQTFLDRVNSEAALQLGAAGFPPNSFIAGLASDGNGIRFTQDPTFTGAIRVEKKNNSPAAEQLGLLSGNYDASTGTLLGEDRAKVRVDCLFTHLLDLREGLTTNDTNGIALASKGLETSVGAIADTRGVVGGHGQRIDAATQRETQRSQLETTIKSQLQDVDFTQAASKFSLLQTQLEAGLRTTALVSQRSLLDFLG
jgi:flagellin-like hook-associated protein FlgL